ncbi:MAG: hypothetical protein WA484_05555 [Solirubrobacteraceae bacterium]
MPVGVLAHRGVRVALAVAGVVVVLLVLAQLLLPVLAARRVSDRVARYGTVKSAHVSAFPAVELLWERADSASVTVATLAASPSQIVSLLREARGVSRMIVTADAATLRVPGLPRGLTVSDVRMDKHGSAIQASATLTQQQLDAALPAGFHIEPVASGGGQVEARASGGFFGLQVSLSVLVRPLGGRLVAEPHGLPLAGLATIVLVSDSHLLVHSVGLRVLRSQPLTYGLSLSAILR